MKTNFVVALVLAGAGCAAFTANRALSGVELESPAGRDRPASPGDAYAWLGPLPAKLTVEELMRRADKVAEKIRKDLSSPPDLISFSCKKPVEIGAIPMMDAVDKYIAGLPESEDDETLLHNLNEAARKGNWLARVQIYRLLSARSEDMKSQYRAVQLMEWMQAHHIGALYAVFGDSLAASGFYSDVPGGGATPIDVFAALHNSYPAQNKVGQELIKEDDPRLVEIGKKMLACASNALPAYAKVFSGAAKKEHEDRLRKAEEATFSPLHQAVRDNNLELVRMLVISPGMDINARTSHDQTPLDMALLNNKQSAPIIQLLIQHGAEVANHGAVDQHAGNDRETLLNRAVKARPANLEIVRMLTNAGAEPFKKDEVNDTIVTTPFTDSFEIYESGESTEILDFFLATKKLAPQSDLAVEYLEMAVRYPKVMDRLLAYGVPPGRSDDLLSELVGASGTDSASVSKYVQMTTKLVHDYPALARSLKGAPGHRALSVATYHCNFEFANWLLDAGAPMEKPGNADAGDLVSTIVERCDRDHSSEPNPQEIENRNRLRKAFVEKLHSRHYDFNEKTQYCPAWLSKGSLCETPEDDSLAELFLAMGADPYLLYSGQEQSALNSAISNCRIKILDLMLANPPRKIDENTQRALDLALRQTKIPVWSGLNCPSDFLTETAHKLISYGAHAEPGE